MTEPVFAVEHIVGASLALLYGGEKHFMSATRMVLPPRGSVGLWVLRCKPRLPTKKNPDAYRLFVCAVLQCGTLVRFSRRSYVFCYRFLSSSSLTLMICLILLLRLSQFSSPWTIVFTTFSTVIPSHIGPPMFRIAIHLGHSRIVCSGQSGAFCTPMLFSVGSFSVFSLEYVYIS